MKIQIIQINNQNITNIDVILARPQVDLKTRRVKNPAIKIRAKQRNLSS